MKYHLFAFVKNHSKRCFLILVTEVLRLESGLFIQGVFLCAAVFASSAPREVGRVDAALASV